MHRITIVGDNSERWPGVKVGWYNKHLPDRLYLSRGCIRVVHSILGLECVCSAAFGIHEQYPHFMFLLLLVVKEEKLNVMMSVSHLDGTSYNGFSAYYY